MILRCLLCIPTFNNSEAILEVIEGCLKTTALPILVLDDGSDVLVETLIEQSSNELIKSELGNRLSIHRHEVNLGKGVAIQSAFKYALEHRFTHLLTIDGDGQHKPEDVKNILPVIKKNPWSLVIGKRKFQGDNVPTSSKFGRKFSNFWVKYQTDFQIEDSQSGFRCYPLFHVQNLSFFTKRYDFEIEVLIRLLWKKVTVVEVEIDVYYPPAEERVSHFDKLWDNVKISLLNTALVIVSLLKTHTGGTKGTISVALGVFFAVQPIYGLQAFVLALFAFVFRLNFSIMFLASQISIPPLIPVWTFISLKLGSFVTGTHLELSFKAVSLEKAEEFLTAWIVGSLLLGSILAGLVIIFSFAKGGIAKREKKSWTGKDRGGKFGNFFMATMTNHFGPKFAYTFLFFICPYFYIFAPKAVVSHNEYFKTLFPNEGFIKRQIRVLKTFFNLGKVLIDKIYVNKNDLSIFEVRKNGYKNLEIALQKGRGQIHVGAHIGGWMLASKMFPKEEFKDIKYNIVEYNTGEGQNSKDKISESAINFINTSTGAPIFEINQALTNNEAVIYMGDRVYSNNVQLISFCGKLVALDSTPFKIAMAKKSSLCFSFGIKRPNLVYDLFITPPIDCELKENENKKEKLLEIMHDYTEALEEKARFAPEQWFNFFPFWSTSPQAQSGLEFSSKKTTLLQE
ncbi:hypothetical protein A9Q84_01215 [Halobacteriovorax marinus]|uniref:Glycosyltransferase 2-like domain-containing protein n=1 Tax=Halobacteriovorax marinus TaxID=97084 RepID=A0A1Y5FBU7_9BACT|nr:hypothetical protein A9Q84_01215 [Halobacteriovorax marinus]